MNEFERDCAAIDFLYLRDKRPLKFRKQIDSIKMTRWALLGLIPEKGIPMLPLKLADGNEEWDTHLVFNKDIQVSHGEEHQAMIARLEKMAEEMTNQQETDYLSRINSILQKLTRTDDETRILKLHNRILELEAKLTTATHTNIV